jgi:hypothetical protein
MENRIHTFVERRSSDLESQTVTNVKLGRLEVSVPNIHYVVRPFMTSSFAWPTGEYCQAQVRKKVA